MLQKIYGKQPENFATTNKLFHSILAKYPGDKVNKSLETWIERSTEFPTPADLVGLIKRNGKPPLKESDIVAINKKDAMNRTPQESSMLREWHDQQQEGWGSTPEPEKDKITSDENIRLRQQIKALEAENERAWDEVRKLRIKNGLEKAPQDQIDKIQATIEEMQRGGAKPEDIEAFQKMHEAA